MKKEKKPLTSAQRRKRKTLLTVGIVTAAVLVALAVGVIVLRNKVTERFGGSDSTVESAEVTVGSITTTISGTGTLSDEDAEDVTFPDSVKLDEVYVEANDAVAEGDLLASVNTASLLSAMADTQDQMDDLDAELADAAGDTVSSTLSAKVSGRIKAVYAAAGDDVASAMYEHGALALLSLDGLMSVRVETDAATAGESVTVTLSDGTAKSGTVESAADGTAIITLTDNGPAYGDTVTVTDADGNTLGSGTLDIHNALKITGYAGTIYSVYARENQSVYAGSTLFVLTDTSYTANYDALLRERSDLEDTLQKLIDIYKEGAIYAPVAGVIQSVSYDPDAADTAAASATTAAAAEATTASSDEDGTLLLTILPNKTMSVTLNVDESKILSVSVGQSAEITVDSLGDETFEGTVTDVDTSTGTSSGGVTRYPVVISLNKDSRMLSGMSASVAIRIESVENALLIPSDALNETSSAAYVYTTYDAETDTLGGQTEVTAGLDNGVYVVIASGLSEGDTVWYEPASDSSSGSFAMGGMGAMGGDMSNMPQGGGDFSGGDRPSGGPSGGSSGGGSFGG